MTKVGGILREGDGPGFACRTIFSWYHDDDSSMLVVAVDR